MLQKPKLRNPGTGPQLGNCRGLQPDRTHAGHSQYLVRRRNEERHLLHNELLSAAQGHCCDALCCQHLLNGTNTALFFSLSGTGKTTLSTDPKRLLIGDDEHGWDDDGVFNLEGGCCARILNLSRDSQPDVRDAIRPDALLQNVTVTADGTPTPDYTDKSATANLRVTYPISHIRKIVRPHPKDLPKCVILLTTDAFGVRPPVSVLNKQQFRYYFLSGYTAKLAGTESGITAPVPAFSSCYGEKFLSLPPLTCAQMLIQRMDDSGSTAFLVNNGWNGSGTRNSLKEMRAIIDAVLDGAIDKSPTTVIPVFSLKILQRCQE